MSPRRLVVLDAPTNLGLRPPRPGVIPGVAGMAQALRARRLVERLAAADAGRVDVPAYSPEPDFTTGFRNGPAIRAFSERLADRTSAIARAGDFAVVLGGDCSVLIGNMLGLKPLGRHGLVFIDGHDDFTPVRDQAKVRGLVTAAGQDLALVTGRGPAALADIGGARPYVDEADVVVFGMYHDPDYADDYDMRLLDTTSIRQRRVDWVRALGGRAAAEETLAWLNSRRLDGYWIHLDVDVLDQSVMPAVDSPNPHGLYIDELVDALQVFLASPKAVGLEITIYDPDLDPDGTCGDRLADAIVRAFAKPPGARPRRSAFAAELTALNREPPAELELYGRFVGEWEFESSRASGEWRIGWILDGRAIQDIMTAPGRGERDAGAPLATSAVAVRTRDPATGAWRCTWHDALAGTSASFLASPSGEDIVEEGWDSEGRQVRGTFSRIQPDSFEYRLDRSDDGETWTLVEELVARRAG
jgi:arginase